MRRARILPPKPLQLAWTGASLCTNSSHSSTKPTRQPDALNLRDLPPCPTGRQPHPDRFTPSLRHRPVPSFPGTSPGFPLAEIHRPRARPGWVRVRRRLTEIRLRAASCGSLAHDLIRLVNPRRGSNPENPPGALLATTPTGTPDTDRPIHAADDLPALHPVQADCRITSRAGRRRLCAGRVSPAARASSRSSARAAIPVTSCATVVRPGCR